MTLKPQWSAYDFNVSRRFRYSL